MLSLFICEDDPLQKKSIETIIKNYLLMKNYPLQLVLSSTKPTDILTYLAEHKDITGLYFLDVHLNADLTGIELAEKIRKYDSNGKIVFITIHDELLPLTFSYRVEALDYIVKSSTTTVQKKIQECIEVAYQRYLSSAKENTFFQAKVGTQVKYIDSRDILFFETTATPHKLKAHLKNGSFEFYSSIKYLDKEYSTFFRCHKSFVINKQNIQEIDSKNRQILLNNGQTCPISIKALRTLKKEDFLI